jgi:hypothetical protein
MYYRWLVRTEVLLMDNGNDVLLIVNEMMYY